MIFFHLSLSYLVHVILLETRQNFVEEVALLQADNVRRVPGDLSSNLIIFKSCRHRTEPGGDTVAHPSRLELPQNKSARVVGVHPRKLGVEFSQQYSW